MNTVPVVRDVLLIGGGHSHVLLMRKWAMQPLPGVRLTLVSQKVMSPYSGMLPGLIAGHYNVNDVHADLARLCGWAGVRFIEATLTAIDLDARTVHVDGARPDIGFDVLSLDTGSTPSLEVAGSDTFSVPVKPVYNFHDRWLDINQRIDSNDAQVKVGVVGSGAGGFELIMAMRHALPASRAECHWFIRGQSAIKGRPARVGQLALQAATASGVVLHTGFDVTHVHANSIDAADGRSVSLDETIWCAAARAPDWPATAGLDVDKRGFVATRSTLQSTSHEFVFATGDIGTQRDTPSDKAGVFAVRQAPYLLENLRRYLLGRNLKHYKPQTDFLSLMATGGKSGIASRGKFAIHASWVWRWKDHIDQTFMNQFIDLPVKTMPAGALQIPEALLQHATLQRADLAPDVMRCSGCGAKVGASILDAVLTQLAPLQRDDVIAGVVQASDTAIIDIHDNLLVQSVDQIGAVCDDPYLFGRIAALHALSDVVTENAEPHSAQVLVTLPFAEPDIVERDLLQLLSGAVDALNEAGCSLIGGHTAEGEQMRLGFVVNAMKRRAAPVLTPSAGDALLLTKPLGTGIVLAAHMQQRVRGADLNSALACMQQSNVTASQILFEHGASCITDVTGFGLLGHCHRMLSRYAIGAEIDASRIPLLSAVMQLAQDGIHSTLLAQNQSILKHFNHSASVTDSHRNVLCDPQTSGGLLCCLPADQASATIVTLHQAGITDAAVIGVVQPDSHFSVK